MASDTPDETPKMARGLLHNILSFIPSIQAVPCGYDQLQRLGYLQESVDRRRERAIFPFEYPWPGLTHS